MHGCVAPGPALRVWHGHPPGRWEEFRARYQAELLQAVQDLLAAEPGPVGGAAAGLA